MTTPAITSKEVFPSLHRIYIGSTELTRSMVLSLPTFAAMDNGWARLPNAQPIVQVTTGRTMTIYSWEDDAGETRLSADPDLGSPHQAHPEWEFLIRWDGRLCVLAGIGEWPEQEPIIKGASAWLT